MKPRLIWWWLIAALGVLAYLYSLGGMHIPSTSDEGPYLQIIRLTAANRMPEKDIARVLQEQRMDLLFRQELLLQGAQP